MDEGCNRQSGWLWLPASNIVTFCQSRCCHSWRLRTLDTYYDQLKDRFLYQIQWGKKLRHVVLVRERFCMTKLHLNWNFIDRSNNYYNSTASTQRLPSSWERLDGLFLSIYFNGRGTSDKHSWLGGLSITLKHYNTDICCDKVSKKKRKIN